MNQFVKALLLQFSIFLAYMLVCILLGGSEALVITFFISCAHALVALVLGIVLVATNEKYKLAGWGHFTSAFLVIIIGFGACLMAFQGIH